MNYLKIPKSIAGRTKCPSGSHWPACLENPWSNTTKQGKKITHHSSEGWLNRPITAVVIFM